MNTTNCKKTDFSLDQIISIIENAFHKADELYRFENNYVFALKSETGQIIIKPKNSFCYDTILTENALLEIFSPEKYQLTVTCFMVIITKETIK